jgi:hypothetical protein
MIAGLSMPIRAFCSIADNVYIGEGMPSMSWASKSPVF